MVLKYEHLPHAERDAAERAHDVRGHVVRAEDLRNVVPALEEADLEREVLEVCGGVGVRGRGERGGGNAVAGDGEPDPLALHRGGADRARGQATRIVMPDTHA